MKKILLLIFVIVSTTDTFSQFLNGGKYVATTSIVKFSDRTLSTQTLYSGGLNGLGIGITDNAGGIINSLIIPGIGDVVVDPTSSSSYGRAGQSSIRDAAHSGLFNPTQAGFHEELGTPVNIRAVSGGNILSNNHKEYKTLIVSPFQMSLWYGDGRYDFTTNEGRELKVGPNENRKWEFQDPYLESYRVHNYRRPIPATPGNGCKTAEGEYLRTNLINLGKNIESVGRADNDGLEEIPGMIANNGTNKYVTHGDEIASPFEYFGTYSNEKISTGNIVKNRIEIPAIRHYHEYRFKYLDNYSIKQFEKGKKYPKDSVGDRTGDPILDPSQFVKLNLPIKIDNEEVYTTGKEDMSNIDHAWIIRFDEAKWKPKYRHIIKNGAWTAISRETTRVCSNTSFKNKALLVSAIKEDGDPSSYDNLNFRDTKIVLLSDDPNVNGNNKAGVALYRPDTELNRFCVFGRQEATENTEAYLVPGYQLNRNTRNTVTEQIGTEEMHLFGFQTSIKGMINPKKMPIGMTENLRQEYYILHGTPAEIRKAVDAIDAREQIITFDVIGPKTAGTPNFYPQARTGKGTPITYTSSNPRVAKVEPNGSINILGAGKTIITASQIGNENFNPAVSKTRELIVTPSKGRLGVDDVESTTEAILVYPNPAQGEISILLNTTTPSDVNILDSFGKIVYSQLKVVSKLTISTKEIGKPGIYYIKANNATQRLLITE